MYFQVHRQCNEFVKNVIFYVMMCSNCFQKSNSITNLDDFIHTKTQKIYNYIIHNGITFNDKYKLSLRSWYKLTEYFHKKIFSIHRGGIYEKAIKNIHIQFVNLIILCQAHIYTIELLKCQILSSNITKIIIEQYVGVYKLS